MNARHIVNKIDWEGFYLYSQTEAEYIEFCLQTKVSNDYARIVFHDGLPASLQHLKVNAGGSHLGGRTGKRPSTSSPHPRSTTSLKSRNTTPPTAE
ncbi:MAG: hypothetical protein JST28_03355 [Acidobacteria bacterium]|nr:hypothetical protein [Acidobacteriota bacterium]